MATPDRSLVQVALCTSDLARSVELAQRALGFADAGGRVFFGELLARVQQLGEDACTALWWLVGPQDFFQIELFSHSVPAPRPLAADWRPCDHGWVRWGVAVADLAEAVRALEAFGVAPMTEPLREEGLTRACYRDPFTGVVVELLEGTLPHESVPGERPMVVYGTASVPDLDAARTFLVDAAGLMPDAGAPLHGPEHEALWGLPGARSHGFTLRAGDRWLEIVRYDEPVGRPPPPDRRLSDQGFMHMAVGVRSKDALEELAAALTGAGYALTDALQPGTSGGTYVRGPDGLSLEIIAVPERLEAQYGFTPLPPPPFLTTD